MNLLQSLLASWKNHNKRTTFVVCLFLFTAFAILTLKPLWISHGWPLNHDTNDFALRTRVYEQHYRFHDFFPIWSSRDNQGFGSPQPALYHKLFYVISAPLFAVTGKMKIALVLPMLLFFVVGAFGMYRLLQFLGARRSTCIAGGICLIAAKYTVTNWLIRGALSEFSAAMIIPWALFYFMVSLKENRISYGLAISLALIFLAHSVMGYFLILLFSAVFLVFLGIRRNHLTGLLFKSLFKSALVFGFLVGPSVWLTLAVGRDYDMQRFLTLPSHPCHQFPALMRFFWDDLFVFGSQLNLYPVQLDLPPFLFAVAGFATLLFSGRIFGKAIENRWEMASPLMPLVAIGLLTFVLLTPLSAYFYNHFPGAAYIQFPWRLLGLLGPIVIALGLYFAEKSAAFWNFNNGVVFCTLLMVVLCGGFSPMLYGNLPLEHSIDRPLEWVCFSHDNEYTPKGVPLPPPSDESIVSEAKAKGCAITYEEPEEETRLRVFLTDSAAAASIQLPIYVSPLHIVRVFNGEGTLVQQTTLGKSPTAGICSVEVPQGKARVEVEMPDLGKFLKWAAVLISHKDAKAQR